MENNTWNELISFINKFWPFNNSIDLKQSTTLNGDLEIYGDDADELIYEFSKKFNINIDNFTISKYFESEGNTFFINIFSKKKSLKEKELTLGDLEYAMKIGRLADEFIQGQSNVL